MPGAGGFDIGAIAASASAAVRSVGDEQWPFAIAEVASALQGQLSSPGVLRAVAKQVDDIAHDQNCIAVLGASSSGDQLAGAAVAETTNGLHLFRPSEPAESVLIVDTLLASGVQILRAARSARTAGARRVVGLALIADRDGIEMCRAELPDGVVSLAEF